MKCTTISAAAQAISILFPLIAHGQTAVIDLPVKGKVSYQGTYDGFIQKGNARSPRTQEMSGALTIRMSLDGPAAIAEIRPTGNMTPFKASGKRIDQTCRLFTQNGDLFEGQCDSKSFNGTITSPSSGGKYFIRVSFNSSALDVVDEMTPTRKVQSTAPNMEPRTPITVGKDTILPGIQGMKFGDTIAKVGPLVNGVNWQRKGNLLFYEGSNPEAALLSGAKASETWLRFDGPNETLSEANSNYIFSDESTRDDLAKSLASHYRFVFSRREGDDVYCARDDSTYMILVRNRYLGKGHSAGHRLQVYAGSDCRTHDRLATDKRVPEKTRNLRYAAATTKDIRAGCLIRDRQSLTMEYKPTVRVNTHTGEVVGKGNDELEFGSEDTTGNLCFIPITVRCSQPAIKTTLKHREWFNCSGKVDVE